jgi:Ser/Thr protein kinase RdoA (MazF antagonist)
MLGGVPIRRTKGAGPEASVTNIGQLAARLHYASATRAAIREKNSWDWGLRAVAGSARTNAFAELTRGLKKSAKRFERAWSTGVEYMAAESIWLSVGVGDRFSEVSSDSRSFVFMNLKWGLAREPELAAR